MPNTDKNTEKKKWYKVWWKSFLGILGVLGVIWGVFESIYQVTEWVHNERLKGEKIEQLEATLIQIINEDKVKDEKIRTLEEYVSDKKQSYAVGFRVFTRTNSDTGITREEKMYRDWDGDWHTVFRDKEYSEMYNVDYYFYIDKDTGEKVYCW